MADLVEIAAAGLGAGAEALVLVNTVLGMAIDAKHWSYRLGSGAAGGGLSGPAIRPVALRAVHDCRQAFPRGAAGPAGPPVAIVGVGGVSRGLDAVELMMAGADAVEVGIASLRDPRAPLKVISELSRWCRRHGVSHVRELVAGVHLMSGRSLHEPDGVSMQPSPPHFATARSRDGRSREASAPSRSGDATAAGRPRDAIVFSGS